MVNSTFWIWSYMGAGIAN